MNYIEKQIKEGIQMHFIQNDKFKTNLIAIFLTTKLNRDTVTKNALIPAVLRRGTQRLQTQEDISKELQGLYGTSFDCGVDKTGDNQVLKFYMEPVNDLFLPQNIENVLEKYPETKISLVAFDHNALVRVTSSNNKETIIEGLNHIEDKLFRRNKN